MITYSCQQHYAVTLFIKRILHWRERETLWFDTYSLDLSVQGETGGAAQWNHDGTQSEEWIMWGQKEAVVSSRGEEGY